MSVAERRLHRTSRDTSKSENSLRSLGALFPRSIRFPHVQWQSLGALQQELAVRKRTGSGHGTLSDASGAALQIGEPPRPSSVGGRTPSTTSSVGGPIHSGCLSSILSLATTGELTDESGADHPGRLEQHQQIRRRRTAGPLCWAGRSMTLRYELLIGP